MMRAIIPKCRRDSKSSI